MNENTLSELKLRLRCIEGHLRGVERMLANDRPCPEILNQVSAIQGALREVGWILIEEEVDHCLQLMQQPCDRPTLEKAISNLGAVYQAGRRNVIGT